MSQEDKSKKELKKSLTPGNRLYAYYLDCPDCGFPLGRGSGKYGLGHHVCLTTRRRKNG